MAKKHRWTPEEKKLTRRYLVWCYKTTKEELDKVDRYFTQWNVDAFVLEQLKKTDAYKSLAGKGTYKDLIDRFGEYMDKKQANVLPKKFKGGQPGELNPEYQYLKNRFTAVEKAIRHFLGDGELDKICRLYETEMTNRILQAREHT